MFLLFNGTCFFAFGRLKNRNLKLFEKYSIIAQFIALNQEYWAYVLNFDKRFQRYLHLSAPKKGISWTRVKGEPHTWNGAPITIVEGLFSFLGTNTHNLVKNHPIFKNKGLFYAKFYRLLHEMHFIFPKT